MKKILTSLLSVFLAGAFFASGQSTQSAFFLDNNSFSYRINPAMMSEKGFFGIAIPNIGTDISSSLGVNSLFYPKENGLVTGLNNAVSTEEFLSNIRDVNTLALDESINLLSIGTRSEKSQFTLEFNLRTTASAAISKAYFAFLKSGYSNNTTYDFSNLGVNASILSEVAVGYAHSFGNRLNVGVRLKGLAGLANAGFNLNKADFSVSGSGISLDTYAEAKLACPMIDVTEFEMENILSSIQVKTENLKPAGIGAAIDLGATYKITDHLTVSAYVLDLGAIKWNYTYKGASEGKVDFQGLKGIDLSGTANLEEELTAIKDQLLELIDLKEQENPGSSLDMIPLTANAGISFEPLKFFSLGALATYHSNNYSSWYDLRAGATLTPFGWLSLSGNAGYGTFGPVCGFAASVTLLCFNLYACVDSFMGPVAQMDGLFYPIGPIHINANFGLCLTFGHRYGKHEKK